MNFFHLNTTQDIGHGVTVIFLCFVVIGVAVLLDLYTGINAAKKTGEKIRSHILRRTIIKTIEYWLVVVFGILIDLLGLSFPWYNIPYAAIIITLCVLLIEGHSLFENLTRAKSPAAKIDDVAGDIMQDIIEARSGKTAAKVYEKIVERLKKGEDNDNKETAH
jgi:hypothetical protein